MAELFKKSGKPSEDEEKGLRKKDERGAKDDWEALKILLESHPVLKQRVLLKLREIKDRGKSKGFNVSSQDQRDFRREEKKREKTG